MARCGARFIVLCAGRRWGKTKLGSALCIKAALEGKRVWWVAPDYPTSTVGWRNVKRLAIRVPLSRVRESERVVFMPSGGWVQVRSAEAKRSLRSEGLDMVVVDEAAHIPDLEEIWTQALRATLADRRGRAIFISTPAGFNYFYDLFRQSSPEWASFQFPTWTSPYVQPEEVEAARQQLPDLVFRQEFGAEFVQLAGALFRREWFTVIEARPGVNYVRAWDLAASEKTSADYTVGALVGLDGDVLVIADVVRGRWSFPDALKVIADTARADGPGVVQGVEVVGMQRGALQILQREPSLAGIPFKAVEVHHDKVLRCAPWLARAEQGKVMLVRGNWNAAFLDEVCAFPEAEHDDQVDAVSAAVQLLSRNYPPAGGSVGVPLSRIVGRR